MASPHLLGIVDRAINFLLVLGFYNELFFINISDKG